MKIIINDRVVQDFGMDSQHAVKARPKADHFGVQNGGNEFWFGPSWIQQLPDR